MRKTTRRRLYRGSMYVLFVAIVALVAAAADWDRFANQFLR